MLRSGGGFTINQVARYGLRNAGTAGPCTLVGASGLPAIPTNVTKLLSSSDAMKHDDGLGLALVSSSAASTALPKVGRMDSILAGQPFRVEVKPGGAAVLTGPGGEHLTTLTSSFSEPVSRSLHSSLLRSFKADLFGRVRGGTTSR